MTLAKHGLDGLLVPATAVGRLERLRAEGLADDVGLTFVLDRVEELVHESPKAAEELAVLVESAAESGGSHGPRCSRGRGICERGCSPSAGSSTLRSR